MAATRACARHSLPHRREHRLQPSLRSAGFRPAGLGDGRGGGRCRAAQPRHHRQARSQSGDGRLHCARAVGRAAAEAGEPSTPRRRRRAHPSPPSRRRSRPSAARQYCVNIANAAADARFAWQKKTLADTEQELEKRIAAARGEDRRISEVGDAARRVREEGAREPGAHLCAHAPRRCGHAADRHGRGNGLGRAAQARSRAPPA